jgi:hypothetical protein
VDDLINVQIFEIMKAKIKGRGYMLHGDETSHILHIGERWR